MATVTVIYEAQSHLTGNRYTFSLLPGIQRSTFLTIFSLGINYEIP